jgi:hypothetical protein
MRTIVEQNFIRVICINLVLSFVGLYFARKHRLLRARPSSDTLGTAIAATGRRTIGLPSAPTIVTRKPHGTKDKAASSEHSGRVAGLFWRQTRGKDDSPINPSNNCAMAAVKQLEQNSADDIDTN